MRRVIIPVISFYFLLFACNQADKNLSDQDKDLYQVTKFDIPPKINAIWNKQPWENIRPIRISQYMGNKPDHFPVTQAKLGYDENALYVIFQVDDQYVKAVYSQHQDPVYKDSCVEFFFSPDETTENGYFNLEMNCGGTMLFHHQKTPGIESVSIGDEDIAEIMVAHSLPKTVDPEIKEPTTWVVEYRIPFKILRKYHDFNDPVGGDLWRANLYKCADDTSSPHWLTWSPIDFPRPNFHLPAYFGVLQFQE